MDKLNDMQNKEENNAIIIKYRIDGRKKKK